MKLYTNHIIRTLKAYKQLIPDLLKQNEVITHSNDARKIFGIIGKLKGPFPKGHYLAINANTIPPLYPQYNDSTLKPYDELLISYTVEAQYDKIIKSKTPIGSTHQLFNLGNQYPHPNTIKPEYDAIFSLVFLYISYAIHQDRSRTFNDSLLSIGIIVVQVNHNNDQWTTSVTQCSKFAEKQIIVAVADLEFPMYEVTKAIVNHLGHTLFYNCSIPEWRINLYAGMILLPRDHMADLIAGINIFAPNVDHMLSTLTGLPEKLISDTLRLYGMRTFPRQEAKIGLAEHDAGPVPE